MSKNQFREFKQGYWQAREGLNIARKNPSRAYIAGHDLGEEDILRRASERWSNSPDFKDEAARLIEARRGR